MMTGCRGFCLGLFTFVLSAVFPGASPTWAQHPFAGVYFGTFNSSCDPDNGQFGIIVTDNGTARALTYDPIDEEGTVSANVSVGNAGDFEYTIVDNSFTTETMGTFTASGVSGTYLVNGTCSGTFSGNQSPRHWISCRCRGLLQGPGERHRHVPAARFWDRPPARSTSLPPPTAPRWPLRMPPALSQGSSRRPRAAGV